MRILNHKGYIYFWEYDNTLCTKFQGLNVDGFRCMLSKNLPNQMYVEIHANGGDSGIADPQSFDIDLPVNVLNIFLDCLNPNFIEKDIY